MDSNWHVLCLSPFVSADPHDIHQHHQHQPLPPSYSTMFLNLLTNTNTTGTATAAAGGPPPAEANNTINPCGAGRVNNCPYYQLYGPPPSYDSVIQLTSEGVVTTSCCLLEPSSTTTHSSSSEPVQVNSNQDAEEIIQEIVISKPPTIRADCGEECSRGGSSSSASGDVLHAGIPLISVKCNGETTQLEDYNTTTYDDGGGGGGTGEGVVSCRSSSSSTSGALHRSSSARTNATSSSTAAAAHDFEEVASTSSL